MGIGIWSPPLDSLGNSVRGVQFSKVRWTRLYFCAQHFCSKNENVHLFSSSLPRFDKCHETSRIFPRTFASVMPGVLVSFLELHFLGKMALLALGGRPQPFKKPSQCQ